ncbi:hypothetical protein [Bacillus cereus]|uniref:hypothetical protein n=1 Tax=Bacillus cereus TaxID=1396 RepID=UPI00032E4404|nr:hypothetical protein [Bacillus cereus]EOO44451.1 hypothetical protein ICK_06226 [Bacillus cereus BAG1X2-2]
MYKKIVKYDHKNRFGDMNNSELIKEIEPIKVDLFNYILIINGKTYRACTGSPKEGILAVKEIHLNNEPEKDIRSEDGLKCPYCQYVDHDAFEIEENEGTTECANCISEIKYVRNVITNTLGECEEVIYHSAPVKLSKMINL